MSRTIAALVTALSLSAAGSAGADDLSSVVARAREQVESGAYADALKTLQALPSTDLPAALAVEAGLLATTATLVVKPGDEGQKVCAKAIVAAGYDPEVARDQSPKVRAACKAAAANERRQRLARETITVSDLDVEKPLVAWQPVRIASAVSRVPPWLRVVARVTSSALEGSFDLALAPSMEGPLRGTIDPAWLRPKAKIKVELVAQDKFGDLGPAEKTAEFEVPSAEAVVVLGDVPAGATVTVDGADVKPSSGGELPVTPGEHAVGMTLSDGASAVATVNAARGSATRVALSPTKASSGKTFAWIATGTAVAALAAGGVMMINAASRTSEIEELSAKREPGSNLPVTEYSEIRAKDDDRKTFTTAGAALLIGGGAAAVLAVTLWALPDGSASKEGAPKKTSQRRPEPPRASLGARIGPNAVMLFGRF